MGGSYSVSTDYGFAISTNTVGEEVAEPRLDIDDISAPGVEAISLRCFSFEVVKENVDVEFVLERSPFPRTLSSDLTRY